MTKQEQETLRWYQDAVEVLSPLRFHLNEVSIRSGVIPYSDIALYVPTTVLESAEEALAEVEKFFTKKEITDEPSN